eukprot:2935481-Amphidinium_carterae.1
MLARLCLWAPTSNRFWACAAVWTSRKRPTSGIGELECGSLCNPPVFLHAVLRTFFVSLDGILELGDAELGDGK